MDKCSICGDTQYEAFDFKNGHICEECLDYIKTQKKEDDHSECNEQ